MTLRRREFLKIMTTGAAIGLGLDRTPTPAADTTEEKPIFSFGLIADTQYSDAAPSMNRYYRESLSKLEACVKHLNSLRPDFVVQLGDLINGGFADFDPMLPLFDKFSVPLYHVVGNHDVAVEPENKDKVLARLGLDKVGAKKGYYDLGRNGWRLVVLNGTDISIQAHLPGTEQYEAAERLLEDLRAKGARNGQFWNGAIGAEQLAWLKRTLAAAAAAGERTVVFCHFPVYPAGMHTLWNDTHVLEVLEAAKGVVAYIAGHDHAGGCAAGKGIQHLTVAGMVETRETAYALVKAYPDRLSVTGFGREPSRVLSIVT